jgi:hypothetical protein
MLARTAGHGAAMSGLEQAKPATISDVAREGDPEPTHEPALVVSASTAAPPSSSAR